MKKNLLALFGPLLLLVVFCLFAPFSASTTSAESYPYYHATNIKLRVYSGDFLDIPSHHVLKMFTQRIKPNGDENGYSLDLSFINDSGKTLPDVWVRIYLSKTLSLEDTFNGPLDVVHPHVQDMEIHQIPEAFTGSSNFFIYPEKPGPATIRVDFYENPEMKSTFMGTKTWKGNVVP